MKTQRKALVANCRKFWDSLDSHLDWCLERNPKGKDSRKFHVNTVIEYFEEMLKLARSLKKNEETSTILRF